MFTGTCVCIHPEVLQNTIKDTQKTPTNKPKNHKTKQTKKQNPRNENKEMKQGNKGTGE